MLASILIAATIAATPTVDILEASLAERDAANDRSWKELADAAAFAAKRDAFRETFRYKTGFHDIVRTPLNARTVGLKAYAGFRIEKVILESAPGVYIAALVFLPDEAKYKPPYAGFIFIPGHSVTGKSAPNYLHTCELGARNGLAAIVYDPLGQGERSQGAGLKTSHEHVRIGAYASLVGETTTTYMLRDAVRVLDYLASRRDIDAERLGASGCSGGGTLSSYLMAVDPRVKAAAPTCYLSSAREHLLANGPQDAEQNFFDELSWGFNHAALIFAAGCPVLINAAVEDFFQIEGARSTYRLVKDVAGRAGLPPDWHALAEAPGPHGMSKFHREAAVGFLLRHFKGEFRPVMETETTDFQPADSIVTPDGEVSHLAGFRPVYDELSEKFEKSGVSVEQAAVNARALVLKELDGEGCRAVLQTLKGDIAKGRCATLRLGGKAMPREVAVTLYADAGRYILREKRRGKRSYYERRLDDEVVAVDFYIAGRSLAAFRAAELLKVAEELERRTGMKPRLVAEGRFATPAKFAIAANPSAFASVEFKDEPPPWRKMLRDRAYLSFADSGALYSGRMGK